MTPRERRAVDKALNELAVAHLIYVQQRDDPDRPLLTEPQLDALKSRIWDAHCRVAKLAVKNHIAERAARMTGR